MMMLDRLDVSPPFTVTDFEKTSAEKRSHPTLCELNPLDGGSTRYIPNTVGIRCMGPPTRNI